MTPGDPPIGDEQRPTWPVRWLVSVGGAVYGPADSPTIHQWAAHGRLALPWRAQPEAGGEWLGPSDIPELADLQSPAIPFPVPDAGDQPEPVTDIIREAWELWRCNIGWGALLTLGVYAISFGVAALPLLSLLLIPPATWPKQPFDARWLLAAAVYVLLLALSSPIALGAITCAVDTVRSGKGTLAPFFSGFRQWLSLFGLQLAVLVVSLVPGASIAVILALPIIVMLQCAMADRQRGVIDAAHQVQELLRGRYWWVLGTGLLGGLIAAGGMLLFCVGILASLPISYLVYALIYVRLAARLGWDESVRRPHTGTRLAVELLGGVAVTLLLLTAVGVVYLCVFH